jgi:hypothetical protein
MHFAFAILAFLTLSSVATLSASAAEPAPAGLKLVWSDEFEGGEIDRKKWDLDQDNGFHDYNANQWIHAGRSPPV